MRRVLAFLLFSCLSVPCFAKDKVLQTVDWPSAGTPVVRFSFLRFKELSGGVAKQHAYVADVTAENLSEKQIDSLNLTFFLFDKVHARIGDGSISLSSVGPHEVVKFEVNTFASGVPDSIALAASAPRTLSITINSVPQGANFQLDGKDMGTTPKLAEVGLGKHMLQVEKEGYTTGHFPFELGPRDANGGSISYELGAAAHDTVELRDGSVLSGDLLSIDATQIQLRIAGNVQTYDRNQVKRILLTPRDPAP